MNMKKTVCYNKSRYNKIFNWHHNQHLWRINLWQDPLCESCNRSTSGWVGEITCTASYVHMAGIKVVIFCLCLHNNVLVPVLQWLGRAQLVLVHSTNLRVRVEYCFLIPADENLPYSCQHWTASPPSRWCWSRTCPRHVSQGGNCHQVRVYKKSYMFLTKL